MKNSKNKNIDISLIQLSDILKDEQRQVPQKADLDKTEAALIAFAQQYAQTPPLSIRNSILEKIQKLNAHAKNRQPFTLDNLPILTADANWLDWEAAVEGIEPPEEYDNIHLHTLESNDTRELFIAWVQELVPEEVHDDLLESFVLLDGTCECHIWTKNGEKRFLRMQVGDHLELKIGKIHNIYTTSRQPVKAILQWLKVAA